MVTIWCYHSAQLTKTVLSSGLGLCILSKKYVQVIMDFKNCLKHVQNQILETTCFLLLGEMNLKCLSNSLLVNFQCITNTSTLSSLLKAS